MTSRTSKALPESQHVRCFTRALKNARYLQTIAPDIFAKDPSAEGFGTGIPIETLRNLHRLPPDSPVLSRHKAVTEFLSKNKLPEPGKTARDALFSGTVHFAQVTFQTSGGNLAIPIADMNMIVQYAQHAAIPISEYAAQYGLNSLSISANLITYTANVPSASFTDSDLQGWVNDMANQNHLPANACIFVIVPQGMSAPNVGGNDGYHGLANIPYIVAGVFAQNLTLQDLPDVYAMVISHEMAEMVVDPRVDGQNPEVCDPCDINCNNLTRIYFDASDNFLGMNQASPPGGFTFSYYICAVVKSEGASSCPAPAADCQYAPSHPYGPILSKVLELVGTLIGGLAVDGSGIIIVNGIPHPVGPWGPLVGDYIAKSDILIGLALEEMATRITDIEGQVAVRCAALEMARTQLEVLLGSLRTPRE